MIEASISYINEAGVKVEGVREFGDKKSAVEFAEIVISGREDLISCFSLSFCDGTVMDEDQVRSWKPEEESVHLFERRNRVE